MTEGSGAPVRIVGRYALFGELASGGMATVHLGRLLGPVGFSRTVAIKRLHEHFAKDPEFVSMFLDEARLCARIRHPNVVPTVDVVAGDRQLLLVMEYVQGESLSRLQRATVARGERVPVRVAAAIMSGVLHGLHAAHEAKDEHGRPLHIVHRDVSPQNVLVGADGVARVLDFGIAKAKGRLYTTQDGRVKGKLSYMAPEQLRSESVDQRSDVFAASVMAWELCTGQRLFEGESEGATITKVLLSEVAKPSSVVAKDTRYAPSAERAREVEALDAIILKGLERSPAKRFDSARDMADAIEGAAHPATVAQVGAWVESVAAEALALRTARVMEIESSSADVSAHVGDVIDKLTSDPDVTKTQNVSASAKILIPPAALATSEPATKAHEPVSKSGVAAPPPARSWTKLAVGGALVAALVGGAFFMGKGREAPVTTTLPPSAANAPTQAPSPAASSSAAPAPSASNAFSSPEAAATEAAPTASAASAPSSHPATGKVTAKPPPSVDCRDPYTRDSLGRKIYKRECL